jgi:hypothetical protein
MAAYKSESELTCDEWRLVHSYRNCRALLRRRKLSRPMRERLPGDLARLEAEAAERRIDPALLRVWRAYPSRDQDGNLAFGLGAEVGEDRVHLVADPPPSERERKRRGRPEEPPTVSAGDLLAAIERAVGERMNGDSP